jgi:hypothetical protein
VAFGFKRMDKIEVHQNYIHIYHRHQPSRPTLAISHGSGGISSIDWRFATIAYDQGYNICILDHFTHRGVKSQWWHEVELWPSIHDRVDDLLKISIDYKINKLLGISAGGTTIITAQSKFNVPGFAVYPLLSPITASMLSAKNIEIHTGLDDDWTTLTQAEKYCTLMINNNVELNAYPGYHAFLKPGEDRYIPEVISFRNTNFPCPFPEDYSLLNHYPHDKGVTLKYNQESCEKVYRRFKDWISA